MSTGTLLLVACVVVYVLSALVGVAYFVLNKPLEQKAPLLSESDINDLMSKYSLASTTPVQYYDFQDYSLGHAPTSGYVMAAAVTPFPIQNCMNYCSGTDGCKGFQYQASTKTCEILSNVSNTYYTNDSGWHIFVQGNPPNNALQSISGSYLGATTNGPFTGIGTATCDMMCHSNTSCVGFNMSTHGCTLYSGTLGSTLADGTSSWKTTSVQHGFGLTSPSPQ